MDKFTLILSEKISTNKVYAGMHWTERKGHAELYHSIVHSEVIRQAFKISGAFPCIMKYDFYFSGRLLDASNCTYMVKLIEDGLVGSGTLPDDTPKYVRGITITSRRGREDKVEVTYE